MTTFLKVLMTLVLGGGVAGVVLMTAEKRDVKVATTVGAACLLLALLAACAAVLCLVWAPDAILGR